MNSIGFLHKHLNKPMTQKELESIDNKTFDMQLRTRPHHLPGTFINGDKLSKREVEVLKLLTTGHSNKVMAAKLFVSVKTIEKHRQMVINKLNIHDSITLTHWAMARGYIANIFSTEPNQ